MVRKVVLNNQAETDSSRVGIRLLFSAITILTLCQSIGCQGSLREIHEATMLTYRDHVWSRRAYNLRYANCDRQYADHFQKGFQAGYVEVCTGGDGYVPALPPHEYRAYEFQSAEGAKCINSWFEGYPAGVAAAKHDKAGTYHDVLISRAISAAIQQEKNESILPRNGAVAEAKQPSDTVMAHSRNNQQAGVQRPVKNFRQTDFGQTSAQTPPTQYMPPRTNSTTSVPTAQPAQMGARKFETSQPMVTPRFTPLQTNMLPPILRPDLGQMANNPYQMGSDEAGISAPISDRQYLPQSNVLPPIKMQISEPTEPMAKPIPIIQMNPDSTVAENGTWVEQQTPAASEYSIMQSTEPLPTAQASADQDSTRRFR